MEPAWTDTVRTLNAYVQVATRVPYAISEWKARARVRMHLVKIVANARTKEMELINVFAVEAILGKIVKQVGL
jgi:hypothetical protein